MFPIFASLLTYMTQKPTHIEIKCIDHVSRATGIYCQNPLKMLNPDSHGSVCHLISTNYGGGLVEGDKIELDIVAGNNTRSLLTTQANTRVYKSVNNIACKYIQETHLAENAFFVQLNDPLVLQEGSIFNQSHMYRLKEGAVLLLADWVEVGRILNQEKFRFKNFHSECSVYVKNQPIILDKFNIAPDKINCTSPAVFFNHNSFINIYLAGHEDSTIVKSLEEGLDTEVKKREPGDSHVQPKFLASSDRVNEYVHITRASSVNIDKLWDFIRSFSDTLKQKELLGFNPYDRKY